MKNLIKIFTWLMTFLIFASCGTRKVSSDKTSVETEIKKDSISVQKTEIKSILEEQKIEVEDLSSINFKLTNNGKCSDSISIINNYVYLKDLKGNEIKVPISSNQDFTYSSEKSSSKKEVFLHKKIDSLNILLKKGSSIQVAKATTKTKESESKRPSFWLYVLLFLCGSFFCFFLNNYLRIIKII